ncbi:MAG: winged helix-turn-helix transcriptional regulator [Bacteroidetes bacterium]|nr:winged helix-turn-helix transcriptional regulator [Bacteroidota bacterium]
MTTYKDISKIYKALSDPHRLRILNILRLRKLCVCEITEILNLATSTVSKHLSILQSADFIQQEKDGKWMNYFINNRASDARTAAFVSAMEFWLNNEEAKADEQKVKTVNRDKICST